jgi:hypothetical protein
MDMKQIFKGFDPSKYEAEVKARWGHTDSYKESVKRTKSYCWLSRLAVIPRGDFLAVGTRGLG